MCKKLREAIFGFSNEYISFLWHMDRDPRYKLIKPMLEKEEIIAFNDIFKFIPKTIVAKDIGKNIGRFSGFMKGNIEGFTLGELFQIGKLCSFTTMEILKLADKQYHIQNHKKRKINKQNGSTEK